MHILSNWFHLERIWREDFNIRRQKTLRVLILLFALAGGVLALFNGFRGSSQGLIHRALLLALTFGLLVLWWFNRRGFRSWVGLIFLLILAVGVIVALPLPDLDRCFVILGLLTFAASFMAFPEASFLVAPASALFYGLLYLLEKPTLSFNWVSILVLLVIAFLSCQISRRLYIALNEAGVNETRYFNLANSSPAFIYILEDGRCGHWTYANPQIQSLLGYTPEEWCVSPPLWASRIHPEDRERVLAEEQRSQREHTPFHAEYRLLARDGRAVWVSDNADSIQMGVSMAHQGVMLNITQRKRADQIREATYSISQSAYAADNLNDVYTRIHKVLGNLIRAENFFIAMYDEKTDIVSFPYFVDEYDGPPAPRVVKRSLTDYVLRTGKPVFASPQVFNDLERAGRVETTGTPSIDWLGVPLKVKERTIGAMVVQSYHEGERYNQEALEILTFVSTQVANAIERKRAEETIRNALDEKEVLVREVHHRVKNNLQVILGMLSLQDDRVTDPHVHAVIQDIQSRISSMALVHKELYQSEDMARVNMAEYFQMLVDNVTQLFNAPHIQFVIEASQALLNVDKAISCGLILNELISNAMKYAFSDGKNGSIHIYLSEDGSQDDYHEIFLRVSDDGVGLPQPVLDAHSEGFGLQIVNILVKQLRGSMKTWNDDGAVFEIHFPAA